MAQRYRVFVDRKEIEFSEDINTPGSSLNVLVVNYISQVQLSHDFIDFLHNNEHSRLIVLAGDRFNKAIADFKALFREIAAAGGIVRSLQGEFLFIKRHGLWDLPKGKLEEDEKPEKGALREVMEETGLSKLKITRYLRPTFHIYTDKKGSFILKETSWYEMLFDGNEDAIPQLTEDITEVRWFLADELPEAAGNTYSSIRELLSEYLGTGLLPDA